MTPARYHQAGVITRAEAEALELTNRLGFSQRTAALALGISRSALRARLTNATRKIHAAEKDPRP